jgi:polar amino acid transport system substrate-binding protein
MHRRNQLLVGLLALTVLFGGAARADQLTNITKKGEIVVGLLGTDEPNSFVNPNTREVVGYDVDLAKAIAKKLGVKLTLKQLASICLSPL